MAKTYRVNDRDNMNGAQAKQAKKYAAKQRKERANKHNVWECVKEAAF